MKTIVLLPVKNEYWILRSSLKNFSDFADHIIIADQHSTDGSLEICKDFSKVSVITNDKVGHGNEVRWMLLEEARKIEGNNLILCIDADEMISKEAIGYIKELASKETSTVAFQFPWIQLWKTTAKYRIDGVWKDNRKTIGFLDDRKVDYEKDFVINDHTSRIPNIANTVFIPQFPLLHFQYTAWRQTQIKQAWYRCSELIADGDAKKINYKYSISKESSSTILKDTPTAWLIDIPADSSPAKSDLSNWQFKEISEWFQSKGIEFFEPLSGISKCLIECLLQKLDGVRNRRNIIRSSFP